MPKGPVQQYMKKGKNYLRKSIGVINLMDVIDMKRANMDKVFLIVSGIGIVSGTVSIPTINVLTWM